MASSADSEAMIDADFPEPVRALRIFVVENHADTLKYLSLYLEAIGHMVSSAKTMAQALESLPTANCDVLISDIGLPDGDGWELLHTVQLSHPVYAIAMSGFGMNADHVKSKDAGYRRHLLKPFVPSELDAALEEAMQEAVARA
jgi:CheY-like chemotaxis protein